MWESDMSDSEMWDSGGDPYKNSVTVGPDGITGETDKKLKEVQKIQGRIRKCNLQNARGNGQSLLLLIMPAGDHLSPVTKMLGDESGKASNIQNIAERQSALAAIASAQQTLKLYSHKALPNGLVLFTGTVVTRNGKLNKVMLSFEPFKPIHASLFLRDNKFHTESLNELLDLAEDKLGYIVMDANGTLFGIVSVYNGNYRRAILHKFKVPVEVPKKHSRLKQSASLPMEKRHNDVIQKTAELAAQFYIHPVTSQPKVSGLILAGSADFKPSELSQSDRFDPCLQKKVLYEVDGLASGGDAGFLQAIELSGEILGNSKLIHETEMIGKYFDEISQDLGKVVYGVVDTMKALEMGVVETLIVWGELAMKRYVLENVRTGETVSKHLSSEQERDLSNFRDAKTRAMLVIHDELSLLEWIEKEYKQFGCSLELVTNKSQNGSKFCVGFGGVGGILRYPLDMRAFDEL